MGDICQDCNVREVTAPCARRRLRPVWLCAECSESEKPDPRDARIAELEAALMGLLDATNGMIIGCYLHCDDPDCERLSTWSRQTGGNVYSEACDVAWYRAVDAKAESKGGAKRTPWHESDHAPEIRVYADAIEQAERVTGRR